MKRFTSVESRQLIEFLKHIEFLAATAEPNDGAPYDESEFVFDDEPEAYSVSSSVLKHGWELWESQDETESQ